MLMVGPEERRFRKPYELIEANPNDPRIGGIPITLAVIVCLQAAHQFFLSVVHQPTHGRVAEGVFCLRLGMFQFAQFVSSVRPCKT
jgi:hypothetical protein